MLALAGLAAALASPESDREADLFGDPDDAGDAEVLTVPEEEPLERLTAADERLTFGGQLWLRLDASVADDHDDPGDVALATPGFLDLFADARPEDRLRAYTSARLYHDPTVIEGEIDPFTGEEARPTEVALDQLWLKFDAWRRVYVTAGQQRVKWGSGRFWNPTDFLNQQRLDPLAVFDQRTGVSLIKLHAPVGPANLYAVANLDQAATLGTVGGAWRAEVLVGQTELAASAALRPDQPQRYGLDLSSGLWRLDVRAEAAALYGVTDPSYEGELDLDTFTFPDEVDRSEEWILQAVAGADVEIGVGDEDSVFLGVEGFFNHAGYEDAALYPALFMAGTYAPFYVGRYYLAGYAMLMGPGRGRWDDASFTASWIGNLSDNSHVARLDVGALALTYLSLNAYGAYHFGATGELNYALEIPPVPFVEGLEEGLIIPAPVAEVGLGARVAF